MTNIYISTLTDAWKIRVGGRLDDPHLPALPFTKMLHSQQFAYPRLKIFDSSIDISSLPSDLTLPVQFISHHLHIFRCVAASFTLPVCSQASPTSLYGIDVSLVAVSLATLFAIVRRTDLAVVMDKESLTDVFQVRTVHSTQLSMSGDITSVKLHLFV